MIYFVHHILKISESNTLKQFKTQRLVLSAGKNVEVKMPKGKKF